jgi:protein-S-isoprenylcysteine O-methyltransferase Ste14
MMDPVVGKVLWVLGVIAWYVIRYPFERRAKRVPSVKRSRPVSERAGLSAATLGLAVVPAVYVATGIPRAADYVPNNIAVLAGTAVYLAALLVFRLSHKSLGKNWSISLDIREKHRLISSGPYRLVRHPMYTSFLLMAIGQALLLPNWIVALAGILGVTILVSLRLKKEEAMMLEVFDKEYESYMHRTKRMIPYIF